MNRTKLTMLIVSVSMAVLGCAQGSFLDSDMSEAEALLSTDKAQIEVEGASFYTDESVTDAFSVISSRSWSLLTKESEDILSDEAEVPWMTISSRNGMNLGKVTKNWPVTLSFSDNPDMVNARNAYIHLTIEGEDMVLPVVQKAFEPVLAIESESTYELPEVGDTITLAVRSNSTWTAEVDPASTASVTLGAEGGAKSGELTVIVKANADIQSGKQATIVLSSSGTEDVAVNITQDICIPRMNIDTELTKTDVLPGAGSYPLVFDTNIAWTATLSEDSSDEVVLSATEGAPGDELSVSFPNATLSGASATVILAPSSEAGLSEEMVASLTKEVTFTQAGCLFITFRTWPDNNGWTYHYLPFTTCVTDDKETEESTKIPRKTDSALSAKADTYWTGTDPYGYEYIFYPGLADVMFRSDACGLVIGSITQNPAFHIEFPAIEGKTLKRVKVMLGNSDVPFKDNKNCEATATGTTAYITDINGTVVGGGALQQVMTYQKDEDWNTTATIPSFYSDHNNHTESMFDFTLTDSQPNTAYRFVGEYRQVIRWFILYYE